MSARLGQGNVGAHYVLRRPFERSFLERIRLAGPRSHGFTLAPRDEHGLEVLAEIKGRGVTRAANAVAESAGHILSFFTALRTELGFYVACLNLHERLSTEELPVCFPDPEPAEARALSGRGLVDTPLALHLGSSITASDVDADGALLVLITGPNRGGKSTFLRSLGIAQLMMQAGMFVTAASLRASVCTGIFTHFVREEDATMTHGKLDEELARMSEIVELVQPHSLLVCNESFASTNELEGSEIARHVVRALVESGVRVFYVTHLYDLAAGFHAEPPAQSVFLRAEWHEDGHGTFRVVPGEPLPTSHGGETYRQVFGERGQAVEATRRVASTGLRGASPSTTLDQLRPRCP
jgi:DNA mismatch repair ATPase MutS